MDRKIDKAAVDDIETFIYDRQKNYGSCLTISFTNRCPLKCEHCFVDALSSGGVDMDTKMVSNIASQLKDLQGTITHIGLTGGEPFLRPKEIKLFLKLRIVWGPVLVLYRVGIGLGVNWKLSESLR